jgi:acyl-CoA reductase-like NAD-dependent aldehyde dehydrogenase
MMSETSLQVQQMFIDGKWVDSLSGKTYERRNPYDGEVVGIYQDAAEADAQRAVDAARRAFDDGSWRFAPAAQRAAVLRRAATLMAEHADSLAKTLTEELGQPGQRGTVLWAAETLDYYAHLILSRRDEAVTEQRFDALGIVAREPVGVVGALPAWNSPLSIAHKACPALAAGCTLVIKPAHYTPGAIMQFTRLLEEAGVPPGAFNVVTSQIANGAVVGQEIARSHDVDMVTLTGSTATARAVMTAAAGNLKKLNLELGGKSPNVIFADVSSMDAAVDAAAKGIIRLAGQSCQAGSRLLIQEPVRDEFVSRLMDRFRSARLGNPFDPGTTVGPLISETQLSRVESYVADGMESARLLIGGARPTGIEFSRGHFFEPTIFDEVDPDSRIAQEEIFGPVLSVLTFKDLDDAIHLANRTIYGLASACWTRDINVAMKFAKAVRAGIVWVNGYRDDSVLKAMPTGGYKQSGIGREMGPEGLDVFLEPKSIMIKLS